MSHRRILLRVRVAITLWIIKVLINPVARFVNHYNIYLD